MSTLGRGMYMYMYLCRKSIVCHIPECKKAGNFYNEAHITII